MTPFPCKQYRTHVHWQLENDSISPTELTVTLVSRTEVKLESLEDAVVLEDYADDLLSDKHGCPAYVSPEILRSNTQYSGRSADMWGLGVMLYTMLVGRCVDKN